MTFSENYIDILIKLIIGDLNNLTGDKIMWSTTAWCDKDCKTTNNTIKIVFAVGLQNNTCILNFDGNINDDIKNEILSSSDDVSILFDSSNIDIPNKIGLYVFNGTAEIDEDEDSVDYIYHGKIKNILVNYDQIIS